MIEIRNPRQGGERDLLIFEVYIPPIHCLMINMKLRVSKKNKPYIVFPCIVEEWENGTRKYPHLVQFSETIEEALKNEILPKLREQKPEVFTQFD